MFLATDHHQMFTLFLPTPTLSDSVISLKHPPSLWTQNCNKQHRLKSNLYLLLESPHISTRHHEDSRLVYNSQSRLERRNKRQHYLKIPPGDSIPYSSFPFFPQVLIHGAKSRNELLMRIVKCVWGEPKELSLSC